MRFKQKSCVAIFILLFISIFSTFFSIANSNPNLKVLDAEMSDDNKSDGKAATIPPPFVDPNFVTQNFPDPIIKLDGVYSHHIAVAEKSTHLLHLYENDNGRPKYLKSYHMTTGKTAGDKSLKGDLKTPEGIYQFIDFLPNKSLLEKYGKEGEIYGVGAFVLNYPNPIDSRLQKTGGGIWLHSTNDESRITKGLDSRGCVVVANKQLIDLSRYIDLNHTSIIIVQDLQFLTKRTWEVNAKAINEAVNGWLESWQNKNLDKYLSYYHKQKYSDGFRKDFNEFKKYKRAVFKNPGQPQIGMNHISILKYNSYVVVQFEQNYESKTLNDIGKKTLYLQRDKNYKWKIVSETWRKLPQNTQRIAFTPSLRFFKDKMGNMKESKVEEL